MRTTIKPCDGCGRHPYQDAQYGSGKRVVNQCNAGWRCTVCGKEIRVPTKGK